MVELRHQFKKPDLYDRLIDRLGVALDAAKTAVRLRNEYPAEVELRGLSHAEFELIEAYLDRKDSTRSEVVKNEGLKEETSSAKTSGSSRSREPSEPARGAYPPTNVIWLRDQRRAKVSAKLSRYSSSKHFRR